MTISKSHKNVLIFGTDQVGLMTYYAFKNDTTHPYEVVGFIDSNFKNKSNHFEGLNVFDFKSITKKFIDKHCIEEVVIAIQNIETDVLFDITIQLLKLNIKLKTIPYNDQYLISHLTFDLIKNLQLKDLILRSPKFDLNPTLLDTYENQIILVTGAAGSIGSELARKLNQCKHKQLVLIDNAESSLFNLQQELIQKGNKNFDAVIADIKDYHRMDQLFNLYKPKIVFHAAAYKHVPLMEEHPYEAVNVNVIGTKNVANVSVKHSVHKFVLVSTDKAVNPTNVMGATKRIAELYVNSLKEKGQTKFITTRFGNVLASNGSVIPLFEKQIEALGPITVTHPDIERYFMTISEACHLIMEAGSIGNGDEIFVFEMGKPIKIYDLAKLMIKLSGSRFHEDIDIKITGLRPGEKINEELFAKGEYAKPTYHEKIKVAQARSLPFQNIQTKIVELCEKASNIQNLELVALIKAIVPEYYSNNSKFEVLDNKKSEL